MEEQRGHRRPTKSSFGHVHSAPFPAKSDAYGEIFDEMANSCSIPFLDLPPPDESFDGGSICYSEIFCGVKGGDFAVDYEELSKKGVESLDSSSGRVYTDANFGQKEERSGLSPEGAIFKDYGASPENKIQSISNHSDDGSNAVEQEKTNSSSYSTENTQNYRADMKTDEYSNKHAALEDASVNIKHGSHSSTSYSASSADDAPCVRTSDIELQTKPSRVAPPTKTPPKIIHKQVNTKMEMPRRSIGDQEGNLLKPSRNHQIRYKLGAPKSHGLQTLDFLDVEVDAGSAAAASVAAMKEAMEQAQARLKHAKELMERQRDSNERRKKLGHRDDTRYDERKDAKAFEEYKNFREGTPNKTLPKEDKEMKDHAFDDLQKITEVGKAPSDHEASHTDAVTAAGSLQMRQGNGFKSSQMCSKLDELCGEWKAEEKFYELANNEKKISAVKEGEQEDAEKKLERTSKLNETCQHEHGYCHEENECNLETTSLVRERGASRNLYGTQGEFISVENDLKSRAVQNGNKGKEKYEELMPLSEANKKQNANRAPSVVADNVKTDLLRSNHTEDENGKFKVSTGAVVSEITHNLFDAAQDRAENKDIGGVKQVSRAEKEDIRVAYQETCLWSCSSSQDAVGTLGTVVTENSRPVGDRKDNLEREISIEREYEKEQARKAKEEKEMEMERDEDRFAVERATREAHERAVSEARERAERIAVERATTEARQRSLTEARGKAQKASAEALEKSSLEKALKEAKLRAERAAVERATAEARERAVEKAIAEKAAAADARRRAERLTAISRDKSRKDNEAGSGMGDSGIKLRASSSDVLHDASFQCAGSSGSSQIYADSTAYGEEESALRCKARSERHQRTVERAAKALAEKNSLDVVAQREQEERNRFAELLDADVRRWSAGKEGNLRALLSTLQYILGPESGWQSIPLTDVITAAAVKKAYRKATLFVHPDKLQQRGASIQQKYICEKVFDLLKEAWNKFNSEEP